MATASETSSPTPSPASSAAANAPTAACPAPADQAAATGAKALVEVDFGDASAWQVDDELIFHQDESCLVIAAGERGVITALPKLEKLEIPSTYGGTITGLPRMALEVDVAPPDQSGGTFYGLACGVESFNMFYVGMTGDGSGVIARIRGGSTETVGVKPGSPPAAGKTVRLRAECDVGAFASVLSVYADGKKLITKKVGNADVLEDGDTWQFAGVVAGANEPTRVAFDNFAVYDLQP